VGFSGAGQFSPKLNHIEMNYFKDCNTLDEARKIYLNLAKKYHPDTNGPEASTERMQEVNNAFDNFTPSKEKFAGETDQWKSAIFADIISELLKIPDTTVEICGSWVWIQTTKEQRHQIKDIETGESYQRGWSKAKTMWYFSPKGYRKKSKKVLSMNSIRDLYGSQELKNEKKYVHA
jgi:hypothetical protein